MSDMIMNLSWAVVSVVIGGFALTRAFELESTWRMLLVYALAVGLIVFGVYKFHLWLQMIGVIQ